MVFGCRTAVAPTPLVLVVGDLTYSGTSSRSPGKRFLVQVKSALTEAACTPTEHASNCNITSGPAMEKYKRCERSLWKATMFH